MYKLTEEGMEYKTRFLPEKGLLKFVGAGISLEEVEQFPKAEIAIGWAKKNNWIKIENDMVELTEEGKQALFAKMPIEIALDDVKTRGRTDREEELKILISRGLIEEVKEEKIEKKLGFFSRLLAALFGRKKESVKLPEDSYAQLTPELIKTKRFRELKPKTYDVKAPAPKILPGKKQPYMQFIEDL